MVIRFAVDDEGNRIGVPAGLVALGGDRGQILTQVQATQGSLCMERSWTIWSLVRIPTGVAIHRRRASRSQNGHACHLNRKLFGEMLARLRHRPAGTIVGLSELSGVTVTVGGVSAAVEFAGVLDLAKYSMALDQGKILSPELRETMWTPPRESNGTPAPCAYGWYIQQWRDHRLVWHAGWWPDA